MSLLRKVRAVCMLSALHVQGSLSSHLPAECGVDELDSQQNTHICKAGVCRKSTRHQLGYWAQVACVAA